MSLADEGMNMVSPLSIAFVDDSCPTPSEDAGSRVIIEHIEMAKRAGYNPVFFTSYSVLGRRQCKWLSALGIRVVGNAGLEAFFGFVRSPECAAVYVHKYHSAIHVVHRLREIRHVPIIYNVADLHHVRLMRKNVLQEGDSAQALEIMKLKEIAAILASDVVISHSRVEEDWLKRLASLNGYPLVERLLWHEPLRKAAAAETADSLLFVGGMSHEPNVDAVRWFAREIWPNIKTRFPQFSFSVVGSGWNSSEFSSGSGIRVLGHLKDLSRVMGRAVAAVAPLRFGSGIKGKVVSALAYGLPCIGSPIAFEGFPEPKPLSMLSAVTAEQYNHALAEVLRLNPTHIAADAQGYVKKYFHGNDVLNFWKSLSITIP
ncbi:glycosyltransferase [Oleomonas cavernae]|uniref:Glycosyltransferase n=1 Tax=Oleomonas cavernae TaxID=2320859 RepID=A0A418W8Y1_9PROT|nr:glycosyltransferase [Oleomonas cavernae]RJF86463.1 glycosyltransferase [Oleomonas cavernae]